jgi:hypothetical protein
MKRIFLLTLIVSGLLALGLPAGAVLPVSAADQGGLGKQYSRASAVNAAMIVPGTGPTSSDPSVSASRILKGNSFITLDQPQDVGVGDQFTISGHIRDLAGGPINNATIHINLNGTFLGNARSNPAGYFVRKFNSKKLSAGTYAIDAYFNGTRFLYRFGASTHLTIDNGVVGVQTIPAIPGITFQMDGKLYVTGPNGNLVIPVDESGVHRLTVLLNLYNNPSTRIEFSRWLDGTVQPYLDIQVPSNSDFVEVGLNIYHQVGLAFVDQAKFPVNADRVSQVTYRSAQGDVFIVNNGDPQWIPASRVARLANGLVPTSLLYSVISVMTDGSNVVNSSQQQFYALPNDTWKISMLLYSIHLSASDGLFNFPTGSSINLVAPDGTIKNYPLDLAGTAEIHSLARGNYSVQLVGAAGLGSKTPVALSRNQNVSIKEISFLDMAVLLVIGTVLTLGLLLYGRPQMFNFLVRRNRPQVMAFEPALIEPDGENGLQIKEKGVRQDDEFIKWS